MMRFIESQHRNLTLYVTVNDVMHI